MAFHGLEQLIETWYHDFPDGTVMIMENYGATDEWQKTFKNKKGAQNGNPAHLKLGQVITVQRDIGVKIQRYYALGTPNWIEKLFPMKKHKELALEQFEFLKGINIPHQYKKNKSIKWC